MKEKENLKLIRENIQESEAYKVLLEYLKKCDGYLAFSRTGDKVKWHCKGFNDFDIVYYCNAMIARIMKEEINGN